MKNYIYKNYIQKISILFVGLSLILPGPINAQDKIEFNPIAANAELDRLNTQINTSDISTTSLNAARTQAQEIFNAALVCFNQTSAERERLERSCVLQLLVYTLIALTKPSLKKIKFLKKTIFKKL